MKAEREAAAEAAAMEALDGGGSGGQKGRRENEAALAGVAPHSRIGELLMTLK